MSCKRQTAIDINNSFTINEDKSRLKHVQNHAEDTTSKIIMREEVASLAKETLSLDAELLSYELRPYSEEKLGFLASHQSLLIVANRPDCNKLEKRNFFVKTMPYDSPSQMAYIEEKGAFRKETNFFKLIVPLMMENWRGDSWTPRCYLAKNGTLVFEDMKFRGFSNRPRLFDEETVKSAVACIARFHDSSLLAEERLNGKHSNELYPKILQESEYKPTGLHYTWFITAINLAISLAKNLGLDTSALFTFSKRIFDIIQPSVNKRNVISHGDLWSSNFLFDDANHCNLVDFQMIRYAPLIHDVMQLLYMTTTREFREKHERQIIDYYYATLKKSLVDNEFKGIVPTYEEVLQDIEEQRFWALVTAAINFPTIMMDGKIGAKVMSGPDAYEAYFYRDRRPFVDKIAALDSKYLPRIEEAARELTEMSLKADKLTRPT